MFSELIFIFQQEIVEKIIDIDNIESVYKGSEERHSRQ